MIIYRLTVNGHRTYPRTILEALRRVEVIRRVAPEARITLSRVTRHLLA
jgi:hypothetical protein